MQPNFLDIPLPSTSTNIPTSLILNGAKNGYGKPPSVALLNSMKATLSSPTKNPPTPLNHLNPNCMFTGGRYVTIRSPEKMQAMSYGTPPQDFQVLAKSTDAFMKKVLGVGQVVSQPNHNGQMIVLPPPPPPQQPSTSISPPLSALSLKLQNGSFGQKQASVSAGYGRPPKQADSTSSSASSSSSLQFRSPTRPSSQSQDHNFSFKTAPVIFANDNTALTLFFTNLYVFSNHFLCDRLVIDGIRYVCTEQYYMYYKAHLFGDKQSALLVMSTSDPRVMKRIGQEIRNFDPNRWFRVSLQVMVIASQRKYEQNYELRRQLFISADTLLVEASPTDDRWGIGLPMDSPRIRDRANWPGLNIMGKLLTTLRERLLKRPEFAAERRVLLESSSRYGQFKAK